MTVRSYDLHREHRDVPSELTRLRTQFDLSWAQEAQLLAWLGLWMGYGCLNSAAAPAT